MKLYHMAMIQNGRCIDVVTRSNRERLLQDYGWVLTSKNIQGIIHESESYGTQWILDLYNKKEA